MSSDRGLWKQLKISFENICLPGSSGNPSGRLLLDIGLTDGKSGAPPSRCLGLQPPVEGGAEVWVAGAGPVVVARFLEDGRWTPVVLLGGRVSPK